MEELSALVALQLAFPFTPLRAKALVKQWGCASALWQERIDSNSPLFPILQKGLWEKEMDAAKYAGVNLLGIHDAAYPKSLYQLSDHPLVLYYRGDLLPADAGSIAIVGSRAASPQGLTIAEKIGQECTARGITVISGLALGIDTAAHQGAMKNGRTIAVIGSGLNHIYPKENIHLSEKITQRGAIISEYPMNTPPGKFRFPRRNRLIAALSLGSLLVEGSIKSGSMNAMKWALKLNKPCFTLATSSDKETFSGNHLLADTGKARLVENAEEMLSLLVLEDRLVKYFKNNASANLTLTESDLIAYFPETGISLEELALRSQLSIKSLDAMLVALLAENKVQQLPDRLYIKVP